jgi:hypothetical protein
MIPFIPVRRMIKMDNLFIFIDNNILVNGMLFRGSTPRQAIVKAHNEGLPPASSATLAELLEVFQRPKFDRAARLEIRESLVREYANRCKIIAVQNPSLPPPQRRQFPSPRRRRPSRSHPLR